MPVHALIMMIQLALQYIYTCIYIYKMVDVCFVGILKTRKNGLIKD